METIQPHVVRVQQRERFALGGDLYSLIARRPQTGGAFAAYETVAPPGHGAMKHIHSRESESFLMFSGRLTVRVDGAPIELAAGDFISFPPGCAYGFRNEGSEPARFLTLLVPGGLEDFLASVGQPVGAQDAHAEASPESIDTMVRRAKDYGIEYPDHVLAG
ncbi:MULTISPECIES: cupin domain-containing protein [Variovorax]|uniref:cupin domain-containing protein n=1 Tax=Variovorax paradoxus TaxID=34073 RepID=UPI0019329BFB|nr:cupin domain-containing protein [Variovorax paradoxus]